MFAEDIGSDEIEVLEGQHVGHEAYLEIRYPKGSQLSGENVMLSMLLP